MRSFFNFVTFATGLTAATSTASAADLIDMPVVEVIPEVHTAAVGGWYLRGDIGYAKMKTDGVQYYQDAPKLTGEFEEYDIDDTWMLSGGIGYQVTDYFRVDLTANHYRKADFDGSSATGALCDENELWVCDYSDAVGITTVMANAYLDLGTYAGVTPYFGGGLGGAKIHWNDLENTEECVSNCAKWTANNSVHKGQGGKWRFAYAIHAGFSYDLSHSMKLDAGYTYTRIEEDGEMFSFPGYSGSDPQGFDQGFDIHAYRVGIRWQLN